MYLSLRNKPDTDLSLPPAVRGRTGRVVPGAVIMLGLTSLFTDISAEMLTAILPIYLTMQVGLSSVQYGIVDGLYHGVSAVARLAAGVLSDRFDNAKSVAAVGYALSALVKPLLLVARSVGSIGLLMSVDRVGKGIRTAPRDAMIAASSPPQHLALNFGVHRTLDNTGAMLGPLIAFGLIAWDPHGYDGVFVGSFAFALIGLATLVLFVPGRRPPAGVAVAPSKVTRADVSRLVRSRPVRRIVVIAGLLSLFTVSDGFIYLALLRSNDMVATVFPLLAVGTSLGYLLLGVPLGRLADRWGRRRVFLLGQLPLFGCYAAAVGPVGGVAAVITSVGCLGAYYAATDGVLSAAAVPLLPASLRASGLAALQTVVALANLVSSIGFGILSTVLPTRTAFVVMAAGAVASVAVALAVLKPAAPTEPPQCTPPTEPPAQAEVSR